MLLLLLLLLLIPRYSYLQIVHLGSSLILTGTLKSKSSLNSQRILLPCFGSLDDFSTY